MPSDKYRLVKRQVALILDGHLVAIIIEVGILRGRTTGTIGMIGHAILAIVWLAVWCAARTGLIYCPYRIERRIGRDSEGSTWLLQIGYCTLCGRRLNQRMHAEAPADEYGLITGQLFFAFHRYGRVVVIAVGICRRCACATVTVVGHTHL